MKTVLYLSRFPVPHMQIKLAETCKVKVIVCGQGFTVSNPINVPNIEVLNVGHRYEEYDYNDPKLAPPQELVACMLDAAADADMVLFDFNYSMAVQLRELLTKHYPDKLSLGPTAFTTALENDRGYGKQVALSYGLPEGKNAGHTVSSLDEAIAYIENRLDDNKSWGCVLKAGYTTLVFENGLDALDTMRKNPYNYFVDADEGNTLWIEDYVKGAEIAFGRWFDGTKFFPLTLINREYKGAHDFNMSALLTGEAGTFVNFVSLNNGCMPISVLDAFTKLGADLKAANYVGFVDMNFMLNEHGLHFLEWTTRWGYPTEIIMTHALEQASIPYADFMQALLSEDLGSQSAIARELLRNPVGVSLAYMFAPTGDEDIDAARVSVRPRVHGLETVDRDPHTSWGCFFATYGYEDGARVVRVPDTDRSIILTSFAGSVAGARERLYDAADSVKIWGQYYRRDIGAELEGSGHRALLNSLSSIE